MTATLLCRGQVEDAAKQGATPLLGFLAGDLAPDVARIWRAPHEGFLTLPAARRHAVAIALAGLATDAPVAARALVNWVTFERDAQIARGLAGDGAPGLLRLLSRLGEVLWARRDYARLLEVFHDANGNRVLRHLGEITPDRFAPLAVLPSQLREARIVAMAPNAEAAGDLALAFRLALALGREEAAGRIARRWASAKSRERLFDMAVEDLCPDEFGAPRPAPALPPPFEAIRTRKALHAFALEFRNCLRTFTDDVARGRMAVYAWRGDQPAALALVWDAAGWRLAEAEAPDNEPLDEAELGRVVGLVRAAGVRTGPSVSTIVNRLEAAGRGECIQRREGRTLYDRLELGDLWS